MEVRKGQTVVILSGKDKGKKGTVERYNAKDAQVVVTGLNLAKRHVKPNRQYPSGGIVEIPQPLHQSKVKVVDEEAEKPAKKKAKK